MIEKPRDVTAEIKAILDRAGSHFCPDHPEKIYISEKVYVQLLLEAKAQMILPLDATALPEEFVICP